MKKKVKKKKGEGGDHRGKKEWEVGRTLGMGRAWALLGFVM